MLSAAVQLSLLAQAIRPASLSVPPHRATTAHRPTHHIDQHRMTLGLQGKKFSLAKPQTTEYRLQTSQLNPSLSHLQIRKDEAKHTVFTLSKIFPVARTPRPYDTAHPHELPANETPSRHAMPKNTIHFQHVIRILGM